MGTRCVQCRQKKWKNKLREQGEAPTSAEVVTVSLCPLRLVTTPNCSQVKTLMRTMSTQMSIPETVSNGLCRNSSVVHLREISFLCMEHLWVLLFQPMKHRTNTLHVVFMNLFSIYTYTVPLCSPICQCT